MASTIETHSVDETRALARRIGEVLRAGDVIALQGDLGAGKTQFVKGLAVGAGVANANLVTSPTFVLMNSYEGRLPIRHYDLYRLESADLEALGYFDLITSSAIVVEWAEKAGDGLGDRLEVRIDTTGENSRRLDFHARGDRARELLKSVGL